MELEYIAHVAAVKDFFFHTLHITACTNEAVIVYIYQYGYSGI